MNEFDPFACSCGFYSALLAPSSETKDFNKILILNKKYLKKKIMRFRQKHARDN